MSRERWTFTVEPPPDVGDRGGRFVARLLKHLLRTWGVRCVAVLDAHQSTPAERSAAEPARESAGGENAAQHAKESL
jgi:hypothetical protein